MSVAVAGSITRFVGSTWSEIVRHRRMILGYLLLAVLVMAPFMIWFPQGRGTELRAASLLFAGVLCVLAIASRSVFFLVYLALTATAVMHQHVSRHWGGGQMDARIEAYFESPPGEIRQYVQRHIDIVDVAFLVAALCLLILLLRWLLRSGSLSWQTRCLAAAVLIAGIAVSASIRFDRQLRHFPPYEIFTQGVKAKARYARLSARGVYLRKHPLSAASCNSRYDRIVIVLGESAISDHLSIFGYPKPTTPFADRSRPFAFDALAPSNQTRYSLGMMLTAAEPGSFEIFYEDHSLVGQLRNCGFHTAWFSNQGRRGEYDSFTTSLAQEADEQLFLNDWSWMSTNLDGQIVSEIKARGINRKSRQATFIHLIGSHTKYDERYPEGFGFPDVSDIVSRYDNSILYTDYVLSELHDLFAGESLLFVYVSDHGQMVSNTRFGSGFLPGYKEEYRTPLLIWTEDAAAISEITRAIGNSKLNLESFDDILRFLIGMSPIAKVSVRETVSILTPEYVKEYRDLPSFLDDDPGQ